MKLIKSNKKNNCYLWMSHSCAVFVGIRCLVGKLLFSKHRKSEKRRRYILDRSPFWILESEKMHTDVNVYEPDAQNLRPITLTQLFAEEIGSNDLDLCSASVGGKTAFSGERKRKKQGDIFWSLVGTSCGTRSEVRCKVELFVTFHAVIGFDIGKEQMA